MTNTYSSHSLFPLNKLTVQSANLTQESGVCLVEIFTFTVQSGYWPEKIGLFAGEALERSYDIHFALLTEVL